MGKIAPRLEYTSRLSPKAIRVDETLVVEIHSLTMRTLLIKVLELRGKSNSILTVSELLCRSVLTMKAKIYDRCNTLNVLFASTTSS